MGDDVISEQSCDAENTFHAHTDISPATGHNLDLRYVKALQSDASIRINPRIGQKGKHETKSAQINVKHQGCRDIQAQRLKDEIVGNNRKSIRGSDINMNPKDESTNSTKYDLDLRYKVKRSYKDFLSTQVKLCNSGKLTPSSNLVSFL